MRGHRKIINSNFSAGELDVKLAPLRSDIQAWQQGCKQLVNMRPLLHGGITTRPGTNFAAQLAGDAALIPFEFSETQGYVLAFRAGAIDIFFDDGTFATTVGGAPWTLAQAKLLRFAQSGDTMILCHKDVSSYVLKRTGAATFTLAPFTFFHDVTASGKRAVPFYRYAPASITATPAAVSGTGITVTFSAAWWQPAHVNTYMRIQGKQTVIMAVVSPTQLTVSIIETLPSTTATDDWDEEAFSSIHGYPQAVCFHSERLVFGGSRDRPSGIWASQVGDFFNFDLGDAGDDKAIWIGVAADKVVEVLHLASFKHLSIFTDQVELYQPEGDSQPWSPKTAAVKQQSGFGCHGSVRPARFDEAIIFVQKYGHQIREFLYNATSQNYSSDALSVMNPSRIDHPVALAAVTASKDVDEQYAYVVQANGGMAMLHSLRAQRITAWSWCETQGAFRDVCTVNGRVFVLVERTIAGGQRFHLERLDHSHALDCAKSFAVAIGGTTLSGASYLEGAIAQAVNNGYAYEPDQISGGVYTIVDDAWAAATSLLGLPFTTRFESLPPELPTEEGSSRGRNIRVVKAGVEVHESIRLVVNGEGANITNIDDDYSVPPDAQSGMYDFVLLGFERGRTVTVTCDVPLPLTVLGLALEVVV